MRNFPLIVVLAIIGYLLFYGGVHYGGSQNFKDVLERETIESGKRKIELRLPANKKPEVIEYTPMVTEDGLECVRFKHGDHAWGSCNWEKWNKEQALKELTK